MSFNIQFPAVYPLPLYPPARDKTLHPWKNRRLTIRVLHKPTETGCTARVTVNESLRMIISIDYYLLVRSSSKVHDFELQNPGDIKLQTVNFRTRPFDVPLCLSTPSRRRPLVSQFFLSLLLARCETWHTLMHC